MGELVIRVETPAKRLDRYLADHVTNLSRSTVQRLVKEGQVLVNGVASKASYSPVPGDWIQMRLPEQPPSGPIAEAIPLRVVFEDEHLLVIDKQVGLVVHPAPGHASGTLVNALLAHRPDVARADLDPERPGIVHRLDRDTSGLLVVATSRQVQSALQAQFKSRQVRKIYVALVHGYLAPEQGAIEAPIGRDPSHRKRMKVLREGGRYARTEYRVREYMANCTLVEAYLLTGRTHQLRVHFASIGHPVVGDQVYGFRNRETIASRQLLHSWSLAFRHPVTGEKLHFTAELPSDLKAVLESLRARG